jgi:hypothetical protein
MTLKIGLGMLGCTLFISVGAAASNTKFESQQILPVQSSTWDGGFGFDGTTLIEYAEMNHNTNKFGLRYFLPDSQQHFVEQSTIFAPSGDSNFGGALAVSNGFVAMGNPSYPSFSFSERDRGISSLFQLTGQTWTQVPSTTSRGESDYDYLGISVDLSGPRMIVGAPGEPSPVDYLGAGQGVAYVSTANADSKIQKDTGPVGAVYIYSDVSVPEPRTVILMMCILLLLVATRVLRRRHGRIEFTAGFRQNTPSW